MIRERTRRLTREARAQAAAAEQLQTELRSGPGKRDMGTQTRSVTRS